jgi:purine nucleosidase
MGGAPCYAGNITPAAEFNMWIDPEAARIVFNSGLPIEMVGWQLSRGDAVLNKVDIQRLMALENERSRFVITSNSCAQHAYLKQTGEPGIPLPDAVAMAIALDPSIGTFATEHFVQIETATELTRGMTVVDRLGLAHNDINRATWGDLVKSGVKTKIYWSVDSNRWKELLYQSLKS